MDQKRRRRRLLVLGAVAILILVVSLDNFTIGFIDPHDPDLRGNEAEPTDAGKRPGGPATALAPDEATLTSADGTASAGPKSGIQVLADTVQAEFANEIALALRPEASRPAVAVSGPRKLADQALALVEDLNASRESHLLADDLCRRALAGENADPEIWAIAALVSTEMLTETYDLSPERWSTARTQVDRALRLAPEGIRGAVADARLHRLRFEMAEGAPPAEEIQLALQRVRAVLQRAPQDRLALREWALSARFAGDEAGVQEALRRLADLPGNDPKALVKEVRELRVLGRLDESQKLIDQLMAGPPMRLAHYEQLIMEARGRSDLARAQLAVPRVPAAYRNEDAFASLIAQIWLWSGEPDKALEALQNVTRDYLEEFAANEPTAYLKGWAHHLAGRPAAATREWQNALVLVESRLTTSRDNLSLLEMKTALQALLGNRDAARATLQLRRELGGKTRPIHLTDDVRLLCLVGDAGAAAETLLAGWNQLSLVVRNWRISPLRFGPEYAEIRKDERVRRLIEDHVGRNARAAPPVAPAFAGNAVVSDKSVAVLPFANQSDDRDLNAFFTDGVQEDILTQLGSVRDLRVVSRTSSAQYRDTAKSAPQIGSALQVAYLLQGSVRRIGRTVRVTGRLIRAANDEQVWAKSYDRDLTDIFAVQAELANEIALALRAVVSPEEKVLLSRRPTENVSAYEAYLKAREWRDRKTGLARLNAVLDLLEQAVALDPSFALAWAEIAACHAQIAFDEFDVSPTRLASARTAIETALRLAPDDPGVIGKLGSYYFFAERDYARATEQYSRVTALRPNDPEALRALGQIQIRQGRWADGVDNLRRALSLDPGNIVARHHLIGYLVDGRRYAEAESFAGQSVAASSDHPETLYSLAAATLLGRGETREIESLERTVFDPDLRAHVLYLRRSLARFQGNTTRAIQLDRESPFWEGGDAPWAQETAAAMTLAVAGDGEAARARAALLLAKMEALREKEPRNSWLFAWIGVAHALLGRKDEALSNAGKALEILPESRDAVYGVENAVVSAAIHAWVGEREHALAEFARLLQVPHGTNAFTGPRGANARNSQVWFQPLWTDPRFQALVADPRNRAPLF